MYDSYKALTEHLKQNDPNYYETILNNSQLILDESKRVKSQIIADEIGIHSTKMSLLIKVLEAHIAIVNEG